MYINTYLDCCHDKCLEINYYTYPCVFYQHGLSAIFHVPFFLPLISGYRDMQGSTNTIRRLYKATKVQTNIIFK